MLEIWRTVVDKGENYDNYKVSNLGRLMSLNYHQTSKAELLSPGDNKGYLRVCLWKNGESDWAFVHRLVAQAFLPNPEEKPCVNHKIEGDEGKKINIVYINEDGSVDEEKSTIEWATYEENNNYGTIKERIAKTKSKPVLQFTLDGEFVREWESTKETEINGFNQSHVAACCRGERKSHKRFRWRYK